MKIKFKWLNFLWFALAGVALFVFAAYRGGLFESVTTRDKLRIISDGCFITGVLFAGVGAISWSGSRGIFDMLGYGVKSLFFFLPNATVKKYPTFYDYKQNKDDKGRKWLPEMLAVGVIFLAVGIVFLFICD